MRFGGGVEQIRGALDAVCGYLVTLGQGPEQRGTIKIALAEALNNIAEHAYAGQQPPGPVDLHATADGGILQVILLDRGRALPGLAPPPGLHHDLEVEPDSLPEGGFGWLLIRELTEDVSYIRTGDENRLTLVFSLE